MAAIIVEPLDSGRMVVNTAFLASLQANGLGNFDDLMDYSGGEVAKRFLESRHTMRLELAGAGGPLVCYLKRHACTPLKEFIKPLLRLTAPIIGAWNEWEAILAFHSKGLPTMTPVAFGKSGSRSFVLTLGLEGCTRASDWLAESFDVRDGSPRKELRRALLTELARIVSSMHQACMNHQDLYLCHFLVGFRNVRPEAFVIDLQRVMRHERGLPDRWRVKDLAQFHYSAEPLSAEEKRLFFDEYFRLCGLAPGKYMPAVEKKSERIRKHSQKHGL